MSKFAFFFLSCLILLGSNLPAFARSQLDTLVERSDYFDMTGHGIGAGGFQITVNLSENPKNQAEDRIYEGRAPIEALERFYHDAKRNISLPLGIFLDDLLEVEPIHIVRWNRIMSGLINDALMPKEIAVNDKNLKDVVFTARKSNGAIEFKITLGSEKRPLLIRSGVGRSFSLAMKDALTNGTTVPRSKLDALIQLSPHFYLHGGFTVGDPTQAQDKESLIMKLSLNTAADSAPASAEHDYYGRDLTVALMHMGTGILESEQGSQLTPPIQFQEWIDGSLEIKHELRTILADSSRERYAFSISKDKQEKVTFKIFLDTKERPTVKEGAGVTLTEAMKAAFPKRTALPKSKIDGLIDISKKFQIHGGYYVSSSQRSLKETPFLIEVKSDFGRLAAQGKDFQAALVQLIESIAQTEYGKASMPLLNFKELISLDAATLEAFETLLKDERLGEDVLFIAAKDKEGQIQLQVRIGHDSGRPETALTRMSSGPNFSAAIQKILEARNVITEGKEYLAIESMDLEKHYESYYMPQNEKEQSADYLAFLYSNPDSIQLLGEHPGTFIQLNAEQYCRFHRYSKISGIPITKPSYVTYSPKLHAGKVFTIAFDDFETIKKDLPPVRWNLRPESMAKVRKEYFMKSSSYSEQCPHIVFLELYCSHGLEP